MREQPVEHAVDKQAAVAEEAPLDHPGKKSAGAGSNDDRNGDSDFLFMNNVDRGVTHERMVKERKEAATSTIKVKQANKSLKAMESNQESSLLSPTEDSICPPLEKRQKKLSDKDGEKFDAHSPARASQTALYIHDKGDGAEDEHGKSSSTLLDLSDQDIYRFLLKPIQLSVIHAKNGDLFQQKEV